MNKGAVTEWERYLSSGLAISAVCLGPVWLWFGWGHEIKVMLTLGAAWLMLLTVLIAWRKR